MAIAYDKSDGDYVASSATATVSVAATAANELAVILTTNNNGAALSSVTVGGAAATFVGQYAYAGSQRFSIFYYYNPPTSSTAYVATATNATNDTEIVVMLYSGAASTQSHTPVTATNTGNVTASITTTVDNSWLVSLSRNTSSGPTGAGTGTTKRQDDGVGDVTFSTVLLSSYGDSNGAKTPTGSYSMQWTAGGNNSYAFIWAISPAAVGHANVKTYNSIASANVKTINSIAIASVKTWNSIT